MVKNCISHLWVKNPFSLGYCTKNNFLINKLGLTDGPELDAAIDEVMQQMGTSNKSKYRAVVYALLAKKLGKEAIYD